MYQQIYESQTYTNCKKIIYTHINLSNLIVPFDNKTETEKKIELIFLWSSLFQAKRYAIDLLTLFSKYELVDLYDL